MDSADTFRYLVGAYYGVRELDEYPTIQYILKDIEEYIRDFVSENPIPQFDYEKEAREVLELRPFKTKLQDALIVLPKVKAPLDLTLLVKDKLNIIHEKEREDYNG